jgi:hypothetical protein
MENNLTEPHFQKTRDGSTQQNTVLNEDLQTLFQARRRNFTPRPAISALQQYTVSALNYTNTVAHCRLRCHDEVLVTGFIFNIRDDGWERTRDP